MKRCVRGRPLGLPVQLHFMLGQIRRGCPKSAIQLKREADHVTPAEAGVYSTVTHSMDSRNILSTAKGLRGNDTTFFRKHDYLLFESFGTASGHLPG